LLEGDQWVSPVLSRFFDSSSMYSNASSIKKAFKKGNIYSIRQKQRQLEGRWFPDIVLNKRLYPILLSLSTQVYKWVQATYCWG